MKYNIVTISTRTFSTLFKSFILIPTTSQYIFSTQQLRQLIRIPLFSKATMKNLSPAFVSIISVQTSSFMSPQKGRQRSELDGRDRLSVASNINNTYYFSRDFFFHFSERLIFLDTLMVHVTCYISLVSIQSLFYVCNPLSEQAMLSLFHRRRLYEKELQQFIFSSLRNMEMDVGRTFSHLS